MLIAGPDAKRAMDYQRASPRPDKLLEPNGSITTGLWGPSTTGAAGGDLSGNYPGPLVAKVVNGAPVPANAALLGSNASAQLTVATGKLITPIVINFELRNQTGNIPVTPWYTVPAGQGGLYLAAADVTMTQGSSVPADRAPDAWILYSELDTGAAISFRLAPGFPNNLTIWGYTPVYDSNMAQGGAVGSSTGWHSTEAFRVAAGSVISVQMTSYICTGTPQLVYSVRYSLMYLG